MATRKIALELTEAQYDALASAAAHMAAESDNVGHGGNFTATELRTLDRAWDKVRAAWNREN